MTFGGKPFFKRVLPDRAPTGFSPAATQGLLEGGGYFGTEPNAGEGDIKLFGSLRPGGKAAFGIFKIAMLHHGFYEWVGDKIEFLFKLTLSASDQGMLIDEVKKAVFFTLVRVFKGDVRSYSPFFHKLFKAKMLGAQPFKLTGEHFFTVDIKAVSPKLTGGEVDGGFRFLLLFHNVVIHIKHIYGCKKFFCAHYCPPKFTGQLCFISFYADGAFGKIQEKRLHNPPFPLHLQV